MYQILRNLSLNKVCIVSHPDEGMHDRMADCSCFNGCFLVTRLSNTKSGGDNERDSWLLRITSNSILQIEQCESNGEILFPLENATTVYKHNRTKC